MKTKVFALHGFLGRPTDWNSVFQHIKSEKPDWDLYAVDMLREPDLGADQSFEKWADNFSKWVEQKGEGRRTLVGYSLGGRLALHALANKFELWNSAVFLSTHPGLVSDLEKFERIRSDQKWAERFLKEDFNSVISEWNRQAVFQAAKEPVRKDENFNRQQLASMLTNWSLARQKDFRLLIDLWNVRQIWAAGSADVKFSGLLKTLPQVEGIQRWSIEGASHRLLLDAPEEIAHFVVRISSPIKV